MVNPNQFCENKKQVTEHKREQELLKSYDYLVDLLKQKQGQMLVSKARDLSLLNLIGDLVMVISCDSNAAIGEKPNDHLKQSYSEMGRSAIKVPLMEVIAAGAVPVLIINTLCVEMNPAGRKIIKAIGQELVRAGIDPAIQLTGSTEDNTVTTQTGIGITVIGMATKNSLRLKRTGAGDAIVCVGVPKSGIKVPYCEDDDDIAQVGTIIKLNKLSYIHEILPVGSKGVRFEAEELAGYSGLKFMENRLNKIDLESSAGASTAVLVSLRPDKIEELQGSLSEPVFEIGQVCPV